MDTVSAKNNLVRFMNGEFPSKKSRGTLGRPIRLRTNQYQLSIKSPFTVYQYEIQLDIDSQERSKNKNKELIK